MSLERKTNVLILCLPLSGHLNPMTGVAVELTKNKNCRVIFYGNAEQKTLIENTNSEFRAYNCFKFTTADPKKRDHLPFYKMYPVVMAATDIILNELVSLVEREQIDLIIYDSFAAHAKWLVELLEINYRKKKTSRKPPLAVMVSTMFLASPSGVYPNEVETRLVFNLNLKYCIQFVLLYIKVALFCLKHGFKIVNPYGFLLTKREELNICCVFPELHPRSYLFEPNVKFAGCFICSFKI